MLDSKIQDSLRETFKLLKKNITIKLSLDNSENSKKMYKMCEDISNLSRNIFLEEEFLKYTPALSICDDQTCKITFAGMPQGHEFTSFILAILQLGGASPKISEEQKKLIKKIDRPLDFKIYITMNCMLCPDVVQSLNILAALNKNIKTTIVDSSIFKDEANSNNITSVPSIYLNEINFSLGKISLTKILEKLDVFTSKNDKLNNNNVYDALIIGGGPGGVSAAIYSARKGIKTALVCKEVGGQLLSTLGIENLIGTKYIEGPKLAVDLNNHLLEYDNIDLITEKEVERLSKENNKINVYFKNGGKLTSKTVIVCTGSKWKKLNVPGEKEFLNKGISYCTHCDGPLFKNKDIVIIGGGNSALEAALDIANIVKKITILEFMPKLKADKILQNRVCELQNIEIIKNAQITQINGNDIVESISYIDRNTKESKTIKTNGVFPLIGLSPNTKFLREFLELDDFQQIKINSFGETSVEGVFAAGDCTNTIYKQIIIAMGEGAKAALSANEYLRINNLLD